MLASRANWKLNLNQLSTTLTQLKASGTPVLDLTESNPTHCQFEYLNTHKLLTPLTDPQNLCYEPEPKGKLEARKTVRDYYHEKDIEVDLQNIFLTASTSEAYSFLFKLLANSNERILIPQPSYPLFHFLADLNDVELVPYALRHNGKSWCMDLKHLAAQCDSKTKAMILVHPNNPTGSFVKKDELKALVQIAKEKSLALISDEVFSDYSFREDEKRIESLVGNAREVLTFTLSGISKVLGLPQMKLAWIIVDGPEPIVKSSLERLELISDTYLSVNTPVQNAFPSWFQLKNEIQKEIKTRVRNNYSFLEKQIGKNTLANLLPLEGGWYATVKIPSTKSEEEWALEFLEQEHVYVHPGYFFDFLEEAHIVLSLLPPEKTFQEGAERILKRL